MDTPVTGQTMKPVTTIEIVDAIERLIVLSVDKSNGIEPNPDAIELCRRAIADGLRFHSAAKGVVAGDQ